ncbi:gas vesicle protein GvpG [Streptomyces sp. NPDC057592]|uniref:gas vesicle protein GvpG n=1 Tax=unclassified Streptomyces TaxID=2593676 RepID=UPI003692F5B1
MGLLTQLVPPPLAPVRSVAWVMEHVIETYDPAPVERELAQLERQLVTGEIDEETFDRRAQSAKREQGRATPVDVS